MRELLTLNLDYLLYFCGVSFILVSTLTFPIRRMKGNMLPWHHLGNFGVLYALAVWLEMFAGGFGDGIVFTGIRTVLFMSGFALLLEFGRSGIAAQGGRAPGKWFVILLPVIALAGGVYGAAGLSASVRYAMGVPGALWAAVVLWRHRKSGVRSRFFLPVAAVAMAVCGVAIGASAPLPSVWHAPWLKQFSYDSAWKALAYAIEGIAACVLAFSLWRYNREPADNLSSAAVRERLIRETVLITLFVVVIFFGFLFVRWAGIESDTEQRRNLENLAATGMAAIDEKRAARLKGSGADLADPDYLRLKDQMTRMKKAAAGVRFYYLMRMVGDTAIFLVDSEPPGSSGYSHPGQVYYELAPAHRDVFMKRKAAITGPETDRWGTWVSILAPLEPAGAGTDVLGIDIAAERWMRNIAYERARAILVVILISGLMLLMYAVYRRGQEERAMIEEFADEESLLLNTINTQVWYLSDPETYGLVNDAHAAFYGSTSREMSRRRLVDLMPEELARPRIEHNREVFASRKPAQTEIWARDGRGERRLLHVVKTPKLDARGEVEYVVCSAIDMTDRQLMEAALRISEAQFRSYFELPLIGIAITSVDRYWIEVNDRMCEIMGRTREELAGMTWSELTYPGDLAADVEQFNRLLAGEIEMYSVDKRFVRRDGEVVWTSLAVGCVRNPDRTVDFMLALVQDISDRKKAEAELRDREEALNAITGSARDGIVMIDNDGNVSFWNKAASRIFGYESDEIMGRNLHEMLIPHRYIESYREKFPAFRSTGSGDAVGKTLELAAIRKDGVEIPVDLSLSAMRLKDKWCAVGIIRDITERKKAGEELAKSMEEKAVLLRELQHRVKNSLVMIVGLVDLEAHRAESPDVQEALNKVRDRVMSLSNLYDLLYRAEDVKEVRLDQYLRKMCSTLFESYGSGTGQVSLAMDMDEVRLQVKAAIPIGLVVNEIMTNSLKYAFPGGRSGTVGVSLRQVPGGLSLVVADDGVGLPADFEDGRSKGMGSMLIGMMVKQLKGSLVIERGNGTTFRVTVPL